MSLTSIIEDPTTGPLFLACAPNPEAFVQPYGRRVSIPMHARVPIEKLDRETKRHIGRAFDYLARAIVARAVGDHPDVCQPHCAALGLSALGPYLPQQVEGSDEGARTPTSVVAAGLQLVAPEDALALYEGYEDALVVWNAFIRGESEDRVALVDTVNLFAGLEKIYRMGMPEGELPPSLLTHAEADVTRQLLALWNVFVEHESVFSRSARRVYNPSFGAASSWVGGADGDLIIDDMLVDFKVTRYRHIRGDYAAQLAGYKMLDDRSEAPHRINRVAIYFARYGAWRVFDISSWQPSQELSRFIDSQRRDYLRGPGPKLAARLVGAAFKGARVLLGPAELPTKPTAALTPALTPASSDYLNLWQDAPTATGMDLTSLQRVGLATQARLVAAGFDTICAVANAPVEDLQKAVGRLFGVSVKASAVAVLSGKPERRGRPQRLPQKYIILDLETSLNSHEPFLLAILPSWQSEATQFLELEVSSHHKFLDELEKLAIQNPTARFVSWSSFDRDILQKLAKKHRQEVPDWLEDDRWIDACSWTDKAFAFPSGNRKLKSVARGLGFAWQTGDLDGREVGGRYETYLRTKKFEDLEEVLRYSMDDVYAVRHVIEWVLGSKRSGATQAWAA